MCWGFTLRILLMSAVVWFVSVLRIDVRYPIQLELAVSPDIYCDCRLYSLVFRGTILRVRPVVAPIRVDTANINIGNFSVVLYY